jgi:hypothetical protein
MASAITLIVAFEEDNPVTDNVEIHIARAFSSMSDRF